MAEAMDADAEDASDKEDIMRSEEEAVRAIERYADTVRRLCMVHLKNHADAEDIFQTVFLKYVLSCVSFENAEHEKACTAQNKNTYCGFIRSEEAEAAHEIGLSCGKYKAFLELQRLDPTITPDVISNMTMREIRDEIAKRSGNPDSGNLPYGSGRGWRHGASKSNRW